MATCPECGAPLAYEGASCGACAARRLLADRAAACPSSSGVADAAPCPVCGTPVREGARKCLSCGASLVPAHESPSHSREFCPKCSAKVLRTDHICMSCGADIALHRRRKAEEAGAARARRGEAAARAEEEAAREAAERTCPCCGTVTYGLRSCQDCTEKAMVCLGTNNSERALEIAQRLRAVWPNDPRLLNVVGAIYETLHDGENALLFYRAAAAANPTLDEARRNVTRLTTPGLAWYLGPSQPAQGAHWGPYGSRTPLAAGLLALLLGLLGIHKFYNGSWGWGLLYLGTWFLGVATTWLFIGFLILAVEGLVALAEGIIYLTDQTGYHRTYNWTAPHAWKW